MSRAARLGAAVWGVFACLTAVAGGKVADTYSVDPGTPDSASIMTCTSTGTGIFSCPNLRSALAAADSDGGSTVKLSAGTYTLTAGQLAVNAGTGTLTLTGAGASQTTIDQTTTGARVIKLASQSATVSISGVTITGGDQTSIDGTCTMNTGEVDGGGIFNAGALTLGGVIVTGNTAAGADGAPASSGSAASGDAANGGGVCSSGPLTIVDSTITHNKAIGGTGGKGNGSANGGFGGNALGGGVASTGDLTLTRTVVSDNTATGGHGGRAVGASGSPFGGNGGVGEGGGVGVDEGLGITFPSVTITGGAISANTGTGGIGGDGAGSSAAVGSGGSAFGGGLSTNTFKAMTITATTIDHNTVTGGITGTPSTGVGDGSGGNAGGAGGDLTAFPLTITGTTVAANTATGAEAIATTTGGAGSGGGLEIRDQTTIVNSTIAGNSVNAGANSDATGGGIDDEQIGGGTMTLASVTLSSNSASSITLADGLGGNLHHGTSSPITVSDTLIAGGVSTGAGANCANTPKTDAGHNLESTTPSQCGFTAGAGDLIGADPLLGSLASNGGPTQTVALGASSPAIAAGGQCTDPTAGGQPLATDQRGEPRANPCDIGAFEGQAPAIGAPSISPSPAVGRTATCSPGATTGDAPLTSAFQWQRDGTAIAGATASTYKVTLADAGHKLTCEVSESNPFGHATATSAAVAIPFPAPVLGRIHQSHKRWREGSKLARASRKAAPVGTTFTFTLNLPARLALSFRRGHKKPASLALTARHAGKVRIRFDGRLSKHRRLPTGAYKLAITAKAHGKRSKPRTATFTIVG